MIRHYIEYFYPGSFVSNTSVERVTTRSRPSNIPNNCFGYRFFDQEEAEVNGEVLEGKRKHYSGMHYFGTELTFDDVCMLPNTSILQSSMRCNGWKTIVKTTTGNFQPLETNDMVITK